MKALFIGGTGNISTSVSRLCLERGVELSLLNRGKRASALPGVTTLNADITDTSAVARALKGQQWDVVANWIAFTENDVKRDLELFRNTTRQYVFISSASVYQKPPSHPVITESTPLCNPYWEYSRNKIACEEFLTRTYRDEQFPITIVRPSLTYDTVIPVVIGGWTEYTIIDRMKKGKPVIIHGDGSSIWTITHAEDFARGFVGLLGHQQAIGQSFHITSDELLTWNQIYEAVAEAAGCKLQSIHIPSDYLVQHEPSLLGTLLGDKAVSVIFDNTKIKRFVPDYQATIPFRAGMERTLAWFHADPARQVVRPQTNELMDRLIGTYQG